MNSDFRRHEPAASYYHLRSEPLQQALCQGLACFVARQQNMARWIAAVEREPRIYCLGKCYCGPSSNDDKARPHMESRARKTVLLTHALAGGVRELAQYQARGGYSGLAAALAKTPEAVVKNVADSSLRGRGGAGFPTGRKWAAVQAECAAEKFVVVNADEGDPGAFSDRLLLEDDPFRIIEATTIAAYAVGARRGFIYLRKEYTDALAILKAALQSARHANLLGNRILGANFEFDMEIVLGQGSYVCGEETALLNSIEGNRAEVRGRPPWISSSGLYGKPTLMNNVETLANVPWLLTHGADQYRDLGFSNSRGAKLISLNSLFRRPGLYEVELGISLREIVEDIGGGLTTGTLKGLIVGGPLAGVVPPQLLDTRLGFEEMAAIGASVGHGGVIAFNEHTSIADLIEQVFRFGAYESCGKCTPCHLGSPAIARMFAARNRGEKGGESDSSYFHEIVEALKETSFCGHGRGLGEFSKSVIDYYGEELARCLK
ncbi:MAG TPA: NADH-ubiquinone oxidoreductase-F iron-sulfur binding region domain-containing protein [Burkholderiales bacterium]|nr:NADH-ubiquinone oxidoreductase-F iron-sulfur binding region domain-containing protein [Burkholderiales bacterium]